MSEMTGTDDRGNLVSVLADRVTHALAGVTTDHAYIHEGKAFSISTKLQFATGTTGGIKFTTPKTTATAAAVTTNLTGNHNDIVWTAKTAGAAGNAIDVIYVNPNEAAGAALGAVVSGSEITFNLANSAAVKASKTIGGIDFVAVDAGTAGNSTTVTIVDPAGNNASLDVTVDTAAITVTLATGATSVITSTLGDVVDAINADVEANLLVTASCSMSARNAQAVVAASTALAGGTAGATITTTANDLIALAASDHAVAALVVGTLKADDDGVAGSTNTGAGAVTAMSKIDLSGGLDGGYVHWKPTAFTANQSCTVSLEEDTSFSDTGTAIVPFNRNRISTKTSFLSPLYDLSATVTTGSAAKTLDQFYLAAASNGANIVGTTASAAEELVLKPETNYLLKVINSANTTDIVLNLYWYEEGTA